MNYEEARRVVDLAEQMRTLESSSPWAYLTEEIQRLKEGALGEVLVGVGPDEYRYKIGFIAALDSVLGIPGELYESENDAEDVITNAT